MKDKILATHCPNCKRTGPMSLVLAVMVKPGTYEETPALECLGCHAYFALGDLAGDPMAFYMYVPLIKS